MKKEPNLSSGYNQDTKLSLYFEGDFDIFRGKCLNSVVHYNKNLISEIICDKITKSLEKYAKSHNIPLKTYHDDENYTKKIILCNLHYNEDKFQGDFLEYLLNIVENGGVIVNGDHNRIGKYFNAKHKERIVELRELDISKKTILYNDVIAPKKNQFKILTVGLDCNIGKMTTSLEIERDLLNNNFDAQFVATGQIGMMIKGKGLPLDATVVDFTSGIMQEFLIQFSNKYLIIEGQGSIFTPLYSGLSLSQIHGCCPDMLILCIDPERDNPRYCPSVKLPKINKAIHMYEEHGKLVNDSCEVIGISINTSSMSEENAKNYINQIEKETNIVCTDPIRFGTNKITEVIRKWK